MPFSSGISPPDQPDRHRGYILRPLQHPPAWGGLCPGSLARDEEQVADTAGADLCQEGEELCQEGGARG